MYSLQIFRFQTERGEEGMEGFWTGEYDGQTDQLPYYDLFPILKERHAIPVLCLWETFQVFN
jgi:hypothetical protein